MRVGYGKVGRTLGLTSKSWGVVGGDDEPPLLLRTLAERWPEHTFVLLGRNSGEVPQDVGLPSNVENPFIDLKPDVSAWLKRPLHERAPGLIRTWLPVFDELDAVVLWLGQHGTSNYPIPKTDGSGELTTPQDSFVQYAGPLFGGVNRWVSQDPTRSPVWLCSDPRNYMKGRDLAWPPRRVLAQHTYTKREKNWRYNLTGKPDDYGFTGDWVNGDPTTNTWHVDHRYEYSRLELSAVQPDHVPGGVSYDWSGRRSFGLIANENRGYVTHNRLDIIREWVVPLQPSFIRGKWSDKSRQVLESATGLVIEPVRGEEYYDALRSVRSTITTPASGSGWATSKPWQCFAAGTVCFFHPRYDTGGHVVPTLEQVERGDVEDVYLAQLARWLRVETPDQLWTRVRHLDADEGAWRWLVEQQRELYERAVDEARLLEHIQTEAGL